MKILNPRGMDHRRQDARFARLAPREIGGRIIDDATRGSRACVARARPLANILRPFRALNQRLRRVLFTISPIPPSTSPPVAEWFWR